jgi:hypothetical protein
LSGHFMKNLRRAAKVNREYNRLCTGGFGR